MYVSIPFLILFHVFCILIVYKTILAPVLGVKNLRVSDFIVVDRHKINGLPWFDKFNCLYCGYTNGISTYYDVMLGHLESFNSQELSSLQVICVVISLAIYMPVSILFQIHRYLIYDFIVLPLLGLHQISIKDAKILILKQTSEHSTFWYNILNMEKISSLLLGNQLEQIESAWCPFKHFDNRSGIQYPKHHEYFFDAHEIEKVKETLQTDGTVSPRKPYW